MIDSIKGYKERFGYYPQSVHADKIYRNRENLKFYKTRGIRLSDPPLGRPPKEPGDRKQLQRQGRKDEIARIPVEGKYGTGKRGYNLERIMRDLLFVFFPCPDSIGRLAPQVPFIADIGQQCQAKAA